MGNIHTTAQYETIERINIDPASLCNYGINALNNPLTGICNNELVVIGADSGAGKSELIIHLAKHNAMQGKRVALFFLEGGQMEAMRRIKWKDITAKYYDQYAGEHLNMDYTKWTMNMIEDKNGILAELDKQATQDYLDLYNDNLWICPIKGTFTMDDFMQQFLTFHYLDESTLRSKFEHISRFDVDLIIIDHLQYFSLAGKENEIAQTTQILRECKNISDQHNIPVVLVSHLRKKAKDRGLPGQEDFYGSSNIPKISTTSIMIIPVYEEHCIAEGVYPTIFRVVKSRAGVKENIAIKVNFDIDTRRYSDVYSLWQIDRNGLLSKKSLEEQKKLPKWARAF